MDDDDDGTLIYGKCTRDVDLLAVSMEQPRRLDVRHE